MATCRGCEHIGVFCVDVGLADGGDSLSNGRTIYGNTKVGGDTVPFEDGELPCTDDLQSRRSSVTVDDCHIKRLLESGANGSGSVNSSELNMARLNLVRALGMPLQFLLASAQQ